MESFEVIKKAVDKIGAKSVAYDMNISASLVYKWCEESMLKSSGVRNPLDRVADLIRCTKDPILVQWLCEKADGYFVSNNELDPQSDEVEYLCRTRKMLADFSEMLEVLTVAISDDGIVDKNEAKLIRRKWERLKAYGEGFVDACERGTYDK